MVSCSSIAANRPGHSPAAIAGRSVQAVRSRPSTSASVLPASPDHRVSGDAIFSAAATVASSSAPGETSPCISVARTAVAASSWATSVRTAERSAGSPNFASSTRARIASRPGVGLRPRRHLRSSRRVASRTKARSRPSVHSGCLSRASSSTGAKPESTAAISACRSAADRVSASEVPAESSMSICQRLSSAVTRRASSRSGVTSAAVRAGVSRTLRRASATTSASWCCVAQSARVTCSSEAGSGLTQASLVSAGRISSVMRK